MLLAKFISIFIAINFGLVSAEEAEEPVIDVYELSPEDDLSDMVHEADMVFFLVMDKSHEDNANFLQAFNLVASELIHFKFQPTQWFKLDVLKYPSMEDVREERSVHTMDYIPKSKATGNPVGSYVYVIREGTVRVLDYKYNPEKDINGNVGELKAEIMNNALEPITELHECKAIKQMCEDMTTTPFKIVMFQGTEGPLGKDNMLYHMLGEIAKREFFLKMGEEQNNQVKFYYIHDPNCMVKYSLTDVTSTAIVLFARDPVTG